MRERILADFGRIEREQNIRVLYACESGSRAWGFPSIDGDYDVRFIYICRTAEYLRLHPPRDVIEIALEPDLDLSGWDMYKTCLLLRKTNPALLEWLGSPIVYCEDSQVTEVLRSESTAHFSMRACCEHYLSMAESNYNNSIRDREQVKPKKYLYALRPLMCVLWLLKHETFPPTKFADVLDGISPDPMLRRTIDELIASKSSQHERATIAPIRLFDHFLNETMSAVSQRLIELPAPPFPTDRLDSLLQALLLSEYERN